MKPLPLSDSYRSPIRNAIVGQVLLTVAMLLLLDGGFTAKVGAYAMAGFWTGVVAVVLRRPRDPRRSDLIYVRWGYPVLLAVSIGIAMIVTTVRGASWLAG